MRWLVIILLLPAASADIWLVTVGPGPGAETVFGHAGIRLTGDGDAYWTLSGDVTGADGAIRFITGGSSFSWVVQSTSSAYAHYAQADRSISEQRLALGPLEERQLNVALLAARQGPPSYDLLNGNCATLLAELLAVVGFHPGFGPERTVAQASVGYLRDRPWLHLGLLIGIGGEGATAPWPLTPNDLQRAAAEATRPDGSPWVTETRIVRSGIVPAAPIWPTLVIPVVLIGAAGISLRNDRSARSLSAPARRKPPLAPKVPSVSGRPRNVPGVESTRREAEAPVQSEVGQGAVGARTAGPQQRAESGARTGILPRTIAAAGLTFAGLMGIVITMLGVLPGPSPLFNVELLWAFPLHAATPWLMRHSWWPRYAWIAAVAAATAPLVNALQGVPAPVAYYGLVAAVVVSAMATMRFARTTTTDA